MKKAGVSRTEFELTPAFGIQAAKQAGKPDSVHARRLAAPRTWQPFL